jgi:uncharacterized protein YjbJ (UPF0337 family)
MNWDQIAGKWLQVKGDIRQKWGKLTDDDLEVIAGSKDNFIGRIQVRYGIAKDQAQQQLDDWLKTVGPAEPHSGRKVAQIPEEQAKPEEGMLRDQHESKREDRV